MNCKTSEFRTCKSNPNEVSKACVQGCPLSRRYRFERLKRRLTSQGFGNSGMCLLWDCKSTDKLF